jgi:hypothetical protein
MLAAFDLHRGQILVAATKLYKQGRKGSYELGADEVGVMLTRTSEKIWTFSKPFMLKGVDRELPAGSYRVATDEELIEGLSFPAYRRVATMVFVPGPNGSSVEMVTIDPAELQAAHDHDALGGAHN